MEGGVGRRLSLRWGRGLEEEGGGEVTSKKAL